MYEVSKKEQERQAEDAGVKVIDKHLWEKHCNNIKAENRSSWFLVAVVGILMAVIVIIIISTEASLAAQAAEQAAQIEGHKEVVVEIMRNCEVFNWTKIT